jgi:hypothetical protein
MQEFWLALATVMVVAAIILVPITHLLGRLSMREPPDLRRLFGRRPRFIASHPPHALLPTVGRLGTLVMIGAAGTLRDLKTEWRQIDAERNVELPRLAEMETKASNNVVQKSIIGGRPVLLGGVLPYVSRATVVRAECRMGM